MYQHIKNQLSGELIQTLTNIHTPNSITQISNHRRTNSSALQTIHNLLSSTQRLPSNGKLDEQFVQKVSINQTKDRKKQKSMDFQESARARIITHHLYEDEKKKKLLNQKLQIKQYYEQIHSQMRQKPQISEKSRELAKSANLGEPLYQRSARVISQKVQTIKQKSAEKEVSLEIQNRMNMSDRQKRILQEGRVLSTKSERDNTYNQNITWNFERSLILQTQRNKNERLLSSTLKDRPKINHYSNLLVQMKERQKSSELQNDEQIPNSKFQQRLGDFLDQKQVKLQNEVRKKSQEYSYKPQINAKKTSEILQKKVQEEKRLKVRIEGSAKLDKASDINQEIFNIVNKYIKTDSLQQSSNSFKTPRKKQ